MLLSYFIIIYKYGKNIFLTRNCQKHITQNKKPCHNYLKYLEKKVGIVIEVNCKQKLELTIKLNRNGQNNWN